MTPRITDSDWLSLFGDTVPPRDPNDDHDDDEDEDDKDEDVLDAANTPHQSAEPCAALASTIGVLRSFLQCQESPPLYEPLPASL